MYFYFLFVFCAFLLGKNNLTPWISILNISIILRAKCIDCSIFNDFLWLSLWSLTNQQLYKTDVCAWSLFVLDHLQQNCSRYLLAPKPVYAISLPSIIHAWTIHLITRASPLSFVTCPVCVQRHASCLSRTRKQASSSLYVCLKDSAKSGCFLLAFRAGFKEGGPRPPTNRLPPTKPFQFCFLPSCRTLMIIVLVRQLKLGPRPATS